MVVYSVAIALMLSSGEPIVPAVVSSFPTLNECRTELIEVSKLDGYELVISPMLSYSVVRASPNKITTVFCIQTPLAI